MLHTLSMGRRLGDGARDARGPCARVTALARHRPYQYSDTQVVKVRFLNRSLSRVASNRWQHST